MGTVHTATLSTTLNNRGIVNNVIKAAVAKGAAGPAFVYKKPPRTGPTILPKAPADCSAPSPRPPPS